MKCEAAHVTVEVFTFRLLLLPSQNSVGLGKQILQQFDCLLTDHGCTLLGLGSYLTDCVLKLAYL